MVLHHLSELGLQQEAGQRSAVILLGGAGSQKQPEVSGTEIKGHIAHLWAYPH